MSTPLEIESFEEYLQTVRNELPKDVRKYFRGQTKLVSAGYGLKPSIGRYDHLLSKSLLERDEVEREVLEVFSNHLVTHPCSTFRGPNGRHWPSPSTMVCRPGSWTGRPTRWSHSTSRCGRRRWTTTAGR